MPRLPRLWSLVAWFAIALLVASLSAPGAGRAQDDEDDEEEATEEVGPVGARQPTQRPKRVPPDDEGLLLFAIVEEMPFAPSYVRLLRINLEPGAISPLHFHPGPEMGLVENGVTTVLVEGPCDLLPKGRTKPIPAEEGAEFEMKRGDQVLYRLGSPQQFRNAGEEDLATILTAVILPAGHQHPPGLTWVDGPPAPNALEGLSSQILGDGLATVLPPGAANVAIDRLVLEEGEPIPAFDGPVMLSLETGTFDFVAVSGETQVSRAAEPGPQPAAELGTEFSLAPGDAAFFPDGMEEVERPGEDGTLSLLRLTIAPAPLDDDATPVASPVPVEPAEPAVIEIPGEPTPTPEPTEEDEDEETAEAEATEEETEEPTEEPAEEPTEEPDEGGFAVGSVAQVNETGVNLRAGPTTSADVVAVLDQGAQVTITGEPVEADGIIWYPVESTADPTVSGWVAGQFLEEVEE